MLDLNTIRQEFAGHLAKDPAARWRMDAALAHVAQVAYTKGAADAAVAEGHSVVMCGNKATDTLGITLVFDNWEREDLNNFAANVYRAFIDQASQRDALYVIAKQLIALTETDGFASLHSIMSGYIDCQTLNRVIDDIEADTRTPVKQAALV